MPSTTKQVLAEQQHQADAERARLPATSQGRAVASPANDTRAARERYLDTIAPNGGVGRWIKFSKAGEFIFLDNDETVSPDEDFTALADETLISYVRFRDGEPPERVGGLLYRGFELPPRPQLSHNDRTKWSIGLSGEPEDPWKHEIMLVLRRPATLELCTFSTITRTGRRAVGTLLRHYDRLQETQPGTFPVVRLRPGGFNHSDSRIGWVAVPNFVIVGVAPGHAAVTPDTSLATQLDDEIPF